MKPTHLLIAILVIAGFSACNKHVELNTNATLVKKVIFWRSSSPDSMYYRFLYYTQDGKLDRMVDSNNTLAEHTVYTQLVYDSLRRMSKAIVSNIRYTYHRDFFYNTTGLIDKQVIPNSRYIEYKYDNNQRLVGDSSYYNDPTSNYYFSRKYNYDYDQNGNLVSANHYYQGGQQNILPGTTTFGAGSNPYHYSPLGKNMYFLDEAPEYLNANDPQQYIDGNQVGNYSYQYNANGLLTGITITYPGTNFIYKMAFFY